MRIKALCLLFSGLILIYFMSFGTVIFAVAGSPSVGVGIPIGSLPADQVNIWNQAVERFVNDLFGLNNDRLICDGVSYESPSELAKKVLDVSLENVVAVSPEDESIDYYFTYLSSADPDESLELTNRIVKAITDSNISIKDNKIYVNTSDYIGAIESLSKEIYSDDPLSTGINISQQIINGRPHNVTTIKQNAVISVFDYLDLKYQTFSDINNLTIDTLTLSSEHELNRRLSSYYEPFVITSDNKLYILRGDLYTYSKVSMAHNYLTFCPAHISDNYTKQDLVYVSYDYLNYNGHFSFRFHESSGHLYAAVYRSTYSSANNNFIRFQEIWGNPKLGSYPILFDDFNTQLKVPPSANVSTTFHNYEFPEDFLLTFVNAADSTDIISGDDVLSLDTVISGYFKGTKENIGYQSNTLQTAGNMLLGTDNAVVGGDKTIKSELSDLEKSIYVLAQQQGITYDELLKNMKLFFDNSGSLTIEAADGIKYSVDSLASQFDKVIGNIEDINGDLAELLAYLKSLNLNGLDSYIQSIEGTLEDLNQRDKDKSVLLGDCVGTLTDLKDTLNDMDLSGVSGSVKSIDNVISNVIAREEANDRFADEMLAIGLRYGQGNYKLYDQCKFLLDNLFNYSDRNYPPNFEFYYDSNGDGQQEIYNLIDFSFLETYITNDNMVDKSWWNVPIKVIDLIRYIIAAVCYGLFVMRLIKRLPTFYGNGPLSIFG